MNSPPAEKKQKSPDPPLLPSSSLSSSTSSSSIVNSLKKSEISNSNKDKDKEKHPIHPLLSPTKSTRLVLGARVIILGTDNVEQRVPHFVGSEAEIVCVPVHPATWFKVKFDNGKVVTFRPSALRLVSDGTKVDPHYSPPPKKPKPVNRPRSNSLKSIEKNSPPPPGLGFGNKRLLTVLHQDLWPSCKVRILSGRMAGQVVTVLGSGNGWVQLDIPGGGDVAKRANELELLSRSKSTLTDAPPVPLKNPTLSVVTKPVLQRRRSNSEPGSPTEISNRRHEFSTKNHFRKERKEMELQREYVQKYINKHQAKIGSRPDLKYWLNRIQGSTVDSNFERNISRDVRSNFCHSCYMEMWSGSKFCWNELCTMSPVYWKLPGSSGTPPLERYRQAASSANKNAAVNVEVAVDDSTYACEVLLSLRTDIRMPPAASLTHEKSSVTFAPTMRSPRDHSVNRGMSGNKRKAADEVKSKRSDSSTTDTEDLNDVNDERFKHHGVSAKFKLSPTRTSSSLLQASSTSPRRQSSPRPTNAASPRVNFKRIKVDSSSPFPAAQGIPPTPEEYEKIVMKHEQQHKQQQIDQHSINKSILHSGPLPGFISTQLPSKAIPFTNSLTGTSPLLTSLLNPDYPTNKAIVANVLEENHKNENTQ